MTVNLKTVSSFYTFPVFLFNFSLNSKLSIYFFCDFREVSLGGNYSDITRHWVTQSDILSRNCLMAALCFIYTLKSFDSNACAPTM